MKRVKTLVDLHKAGANVEGLRFIEIKGKDLRAADLDEVLRKIAATSDTFEAALFASVKAIVAGLLNIGDEGEFIGIDGLPAHPVQVPGQTRLVPPQVRP